MNDENDENDIKENEDKTSKSSKVSLSSKKSTKSDGQDTEVRELKTENDTLRAQVDTYKVNKFDKFQYSEILTNSRGAVLRKKKKWFRHTTLSV